MTNHHANPPGGRFVPARALALLGLSLLAPALPAAPPGSLRVKEGGQITEYRAAFDELAVNGLGGETVRLPAVNSLEAAQARAASWRQTHGQPAALVFYPAQGPRNEATRRLLTTDLAVRLARGVNAEALATGVGAHSVAALSGAADWRVFLAATPSDTLDLAVRLAAQPGVLAVQPQLARQHARKLLPNDPYFWQLWHLRNTGLNQGVPGMDVQVTNVWNTLRGNGTVIGIVDDGVQGGHPDLAANYSEELSTNLNAGPFNPTYDSHGTMVAGTAAARGDNGIGTVGVAYEATLANIRLISEFTSDATDAQAMLHRNDVIQVKNNSWGGVDTSPSVLDGPGPLMVAAIAEGVTTGRGGLGTIYVFAGGNGRAYGENVNDDGYANQAEVIAVGAVDDRGQQSTFSEPGACLTVCAPSGSGPDLCAGGRQRILTTDLQGTDGKNWLFATCDLPDRDYTQNFSGTSAATPIVSGVIALMLQANPELGWRDVKEILLRSATRVSTTDPDWATNSAGIAHNPKFGGGLVNAERAVQMATGWINLPPPATLTTLSNDLFLPLPDNDPAGLTLSFTVSEDNFRVEQARLTLWAPHERYGDLDVTLTSPSGITSKLASVHSTASAGYYGWSFTSVRHWGENARGVWTLKIADLVPGQTGSLEAAQLELLGSHPARFWMTTTAASLPVLHASYSASGWPCRDFTFQTSTNLTDWADLGTTSLCNGGTLEFTDTEAPNFPQRFYRLRW